MNPIETFQPPTDSVYKFMALTGLLLFSGFLTLYWHSFRTFSEKLLAAKLRGPVLEKKLEIMNKHQQAVADDHLKRRDEVIEVACAQVEHSVLTSEVEGFKGGVVTLHWLLPFALVFSVSLSGSGFSLWDYRVQVPQDRLLVLEVAGREGQTNQKPEVTVPANSRPHQ